jgi:UDP-3-O-[3-hydroxymyristoyl] glucosamine N-acyltransferase
MRLQHLKQIAGALAIGDRARVTAKAMMVTEVERLRIWNGGAKNARKSIARIRAVMPQIRGEPGNRRSMAPSRKL